MQGERPRLPVELILHIMSSLLPANPNSLMPSNTTDSKTLRAFTLVCRATNPLAKRLLRQRCMWIDSDRRLRNLLVCIPRQAPDDRNALRYMTSLCLSPFPRSLDDLPTALWVRELFCIVWPTLRRLIVDMPMRSLWPADDHLDVRARLREGFEMLVNLEEFVSVRDELFLCVQEPMLRAGEREVWTLWPKLKRLALYNVDAVPAFWQMVAQARELEMLVLTRADGIQDDCMKTPYFAETDRPIKVLIVDVPESQPERLPRWRWREADPEMKMRVMVYDVPTSFYGDEDRTTLCQEWVKAGAYRGDLWDWEGYLLKPAPVGFGLRNPDEGFVW